MAHIASGLGLGSALAGLTYGLTGEPIPTAVTGVAGLLVGSAMAAYDPRRARAQGTPVVEQRVAVNPAHHGRGVVFVNPDNVVAYGEPVDQVNQPAYGAHGYSHPAIREHTRQMMGRRVRHAQMRELLGRHDDTDFTVRNPLRR